MTRKTTKSEMAVRRMFRFLREVERADAFTLADLYDAKRALGTKRIDVGTTVRRMVERGDVEALKIEGMGGGLTFYRLVEGGSN